MDLKQLRTFRAVAELGSLSKAADRLRAAQPALSRHIKLLEHELRVELFVRNGRGMLLTSAGRMLLDRTTGLVRQIEQVRDDLQSASGKPSGRVILGLVPTVSAVFSGRFARRVITDFPDVSLRWTGQPIALKSVVSSVGANARILETRQFNGTQPLLGEVIDDTGRLRATDYKTGKVRAQRGDPALDIGHDFARR